MNRRRSVVATACASIVVVVASVAFAVAPAAGATRGNARAPIRLLRRTAPLRQVARSQHQVPKAADGSFAAELADLPWVKKHNRAENEFGTHDAPAPSSLLPKATNVPVGNGVGLGSSFEGLNHFDSRYSDNGNEFSGEPPDQGLCVNDRYAMEIVNSVVQVYTPDGTPQIAGDKAFPSGPDVGLSLNQFYGFPPGFVRPDGPFGPELFDVSCLWDQTQQRWYATADLLGLDATTSAFTGETAVVVAVSDSADPLGSWNVYYLNTQNNGTGGTPDHGCSGGYCFADYPQTGLDANGFYITSNEFDLLGNGEFHGAQLYAFSKADMAAGDASPTSAYLQNVRTNTAYDLAYTLQPANSLPSDYASSNAGTMYFGMSLSPFTAEGDVANALVLYSLIDTSSLNGSVPALKLKEASVGTETYGVPAHALQKAGGKTPLLHCINIGVNCIGTSAPKIPSPIPLDGGSGKFYGAWLHDGVVYLATATALAGKGGADYDSTNGNWWPISQRVGVAYFGVQPSSPTSVSLTQQGYVAVKHNNLIYPSIAVDADGHAAIGVTLTGPDYFPTAAYAPFQVGSAPASVQVAGLGVGPDDGFTGTDQGGYRPRWGDYGTATVAPDGSIWLAAEYIAQKCGFAKFVNDTTCGYTRTFYANWSTHVMQITGM